jgi:drug/metabolite transporter (DMT)-like permease
LQNSKLWPVILVLILIQILFGINFPASKIIVKQMDPILWSNIRFLLAGVGMLFVTLAFRRKHPKVDKEFLQSVIPLSLLGLALGQGLFLTGLKYTTAINSSIMTTCIPILTLLIVVIRKQEDLTFNKLSGFVLAFMGVVLMRDITNFSLSNSTLIGDALVFSGTVCFALYLSFGKAFFKKYDNMWSTTWMFFISGFAMTFLNLGKFQELSTIELSTEFKLCAVFSIIGATLLTYLLNNWALQKIAAGSVAVFIYLQPVVAGVIAYFYLGEVVTFRMILCSVLILAGLLFTIIKPKQIKPKVQ